MMKFICSALFLAILLAAPACHKHDHDDDSDNTFPVVTINKPAEAASITGALQVAIAVTDNSLHEMSVQVQKSDGSVLVNEKPTVHDQSAYNFDKTFNLNGLTTETPLTLKVKVEDHGGNVTEKTLKFNYKS